MARLIFLGSPAIAVPSLEALVGAGHELLAVVTQPDKAKGRGKRLAVTAVKDFALSAGLPLLQPLQASEPDFLQSLQQLAPDYFVVVAYGQILTKEFLDMAPAINLHFSLLPKYRGAACVAQALMDGQEESGVTTILIEKKLDAGPILLQWTEAIKPADTVLTLSERLSTLGAAQLVKTLAELELGRLRPVSQRAEAASYAPKIKKVQGHLDWSKPAEEIYHHYQGLTPWPGVYGFVAGKRVILTKLRQSQLVTQESPGTLFAQKNKLYVGTEKGVLEVLEIKPEGKKSLLAEDFIKGYASFLGKKMN